MEASNRKRARDEGPENIDILEAKRQSCPNLVSNHDDPSCDDGKPYEFHDGVGVFDFPWLKEGVVFDSEPDEEEKFAPCSYDLNENLDESCSSKILSLSPNSHDSKNDDDSLWSLLVDDLDPLDCIWSCVIDHPLDLGFNKG